MDDELAAWGVTRNPEPEPEVVEVWEEHREALMWWCQGGNQLKFNGNCCLGLDVVALQADACMAGRRVSPDTYQRMQLIGRQVAEHLNRQVGNYARP